ncbi:MAG: hypothetical protein AAFU66_09080, partial [Pseudomonadota bacterium]
IDNFWLMLAIQFGVIPPILILIAVLAAMIALARKSLVTNKPDRDLQRGLIMSLAVFTMGASTVALWLSPQVWFFALLGIVVTLGQQAPVRGPGFMHSTPPRQTARGTRISPAALQRNPPRNRA